MHITQGNQISAEAEPREHNKTEIGVAGVRRIVYGVLVPRLQSLRSLFENEGRK